MHFGIRAKLISAFLVIVSLTLISSAVSFYSIRAFKTALDEVVVERVPAMSEALLMKTAVDGALSALARIVQNKEGGAQADWQQVEANLKQADTALQALQGKGLDHAQRGQLQSYLSDLKTQIAEIRSLLSASVMYRNEMRTLLKIRGKISIRCGWMSVRILMWNVNFRIRLLILLRGQIKSRQAKCRS
jgi:phosphoglycerate-specific signal transduction histidine kinase